MNTNQNPLPIALFLGITGGIITACAIGAYQIVAGMSQSAKDAAGILLTVLPIASLFAMAIIIWLTRRKPQNRQHVDNVIDMGLYHVQYPLPRQLPQHAPQQAISAPAGPQYDETLIYAPPQANKARNWAIVDEVKR